MAQRRKVLIAEDEEAICLAMEETLAYEGYEVRCVPNGLEALKSLEEWRPDLVVLDLKMPLMDGEAFRRAQLRYEAGLRDVPIIVLSGSSDARERAEAMGAVGVITKPFDLGEATAIVRNSFDRRSA